MQNKKRKIITQIGSLPFKNIISSVEYSLKHDIPFLPELPKLGDGMLEYIKNPGQLSCLKEFKKHQFNIVKIQCVGPATLFLSGYDDEAVERVCEHFFVILNGLKTDEVIIFLDEPALGYVPFDFETLWSPIFETLKISFGNKFKMVFGVHVCGNMDWDKLFRSEIIEIISFDASPLVKASGSAQSEGYVAEKFDITLSPLYRSGKRISWGISKKEDIKDFQKGDLITPPCGLGLYNAKYCQQEFEKLNKIAAESMG